MNRRRMSLLASSPTMVGAVTVLIVIVAVFLAYNANSGLPFVPTYRVSVLVPDAASLVPGNDVRIGGVRVGQVESIAPVQRPNGRDVAKLGLKLDASVAELPRNSSFIIRAQSALGGGYVQITKGNSTATFPEGSLIGLSHAHPIPVQLDQLLNTFDEPTRLAIRRNLLEFGDALAGRGPDLNQAIGELPPLVDRLRAVMRNLSAPATQLARFFPSLGAVMAELAPVAETQARFFVSADTTFTALASVARPFIQETISRTPATLDVADQALPKIRPFLQHSAVLFRDLQPGVEALRATAPAIASALEIGAPVLAKAPRLNRQLPPTADTLHRFAHDSDVRTAIDRLNQAVDVLRPTLSFVTPAQTVCNYGTLFFRNVGSAVSVGDGLGTWQRFITMAPPEGPNNEGSPASKPANGGGPVADANFLHVNPYPNTAAPGQTHECEAGNEPYLAGRQVIGNVPGNQGTATEDQP